MSTRQITKSIVLIAALAAVSAQAATITFDEPGHAHGLSVNGINGWTSVGYENTYNSVPIETGSGLVLYSDGLNAGRATKEITGDIAGVTTVTFLLKTYNSGIGEFSITSGNINLGNGENVGAAMWLWIDGTDEAAGVNDHNFRVYGSGTGAPTSYNYIRGESYKFTATLNYNTGQITSSSLEDLTGSLGTQSTSTPIDFYTATTLAAAQAKTSIVIGGVGRTGFDNITIVPTLWHEDFENNADTAGTLGPLNGQHGWMSGAGAVVQDSVSQSGSQALQLQNAAASQLFEDTAALTNVQITFHAWVHADGGVPALPEKAAALFYVDADQHLVVYSNTVPVVLPVVVETNRWTEFMVTCDYVAQTWRLRVDGVAVADEVPFYSPQAGFSELTVIDGASAGYSYVDAITVAQQIFTEDDTDGDGLPDVWEIFYYGGLWINPSDPSADGIHAVWEAYVAGFDPTDPAGSFGIAGISTGSGAGHILQWDEAPGRLYTIYWSSNLFSSFSVLQAGYVGSAFTDTTHNASSEGFYRLDVEVAP